MSIDPKIVDYVAGLANLEVAGDEREEVAAQFGRMIDFIAQLDEIDIEGVAPTKHVVGLENVARADQPAPCLTQEQALANAPDADEGHFVVPKVIPS